ncbi:MAG TPA: site-specific DNA-methyltransferase [bacterium]|jgi:DNA modification methylase|nr:site-specific DNA-methyltransferase [bacterium]
MDFNFYQGNCADILRAKVPSDSVDIILTSPPYTCPNDVGMRKYHGFTFPFPDIAAELTRVLKPNGVMVWIEGDASRNFCETGMSWRHALHFMDVCKLSLLDTCIYYKNASPYPGIRGCTYNQVFEYVFCMVKPGTTNRPRFFSPIKDKPNSQKGKRCKAITRKGYGDKIVKSDKEFVIGDFGIRNNVMLYEVGGFKSAKDPEASRHCAIAPFNLCFDMCRTYIPTDAIERKKLTILDPFIGSGQSLLAGKALGLGRGIGIDISPEFLKLAKFRCTSDRILKLNYPVKESHKI